jgi:hypothetical protein
VGSGSSPARAPRIRSAQRARSGYGALPSARGVAAKGTGCCPPGPGRNARTWSSRGWVRASTRRVRFAPGAARSRAARLAHYPALVPRNGRGRALSTFLEGAGASGTGQRVGQALGYGSPNGSRLLPSGGFGGPNGSRELPSRSQMLLTRVHASGITLQSAARVSRGEGRVAARGLSASARGGRRRAAARTTGATVRTRDKPPMRVFLSRDEPSGASDDTRGRPWHKGTRNEDRSYREGYRQSGQGSRPGGLPG